MTYVPTLKKMYKEQVVPALVKEFGYSSVMQVPVLEKIVINQGLGQAVADKKIIETALDELSKITGQKAVTTKSKKDISNFKLRKGMTIGARVTLRHNKMYEFLERLVAVALPRIRDFKGINDKFDGQGNYTLGITEQIIFPEIDIDKITKILGMEITFVTSAATDEEAYALLKQFGLPFKNIKRTKQYGKRINESPRGETPQTGRALRCQTGCAERSRGLRRSGQAAAQFEPDPPAQPLQTDRPPERIHANVRYQPYPVPRNGFPGADSRREESELVDILRLRVKN